MDLELKRKLVIQQAIIWASVLLGNMILLIVLDNWDGRFTFPTVSMFNLQLNFFLFIVAFAHLQKMLGKVETLESKSDQSDSDKGTKS